MRSYLRKKLIQLSRTETNRQVDTGASHTPLWAQVLKEVGEEIMFI